MERTFSTREQAEAAGYRRAKAGAMVDGYLCIDISNHPSFGYEFALVPADYDPDPERLLEQAVSISVTVRLDGERNAGGSVGAYAQMFAPPLPGDCEHCRYDGEHIERIGDAEILRWDDVQREAESVECVVDTLLGWDQYSHLFAVTLPGGERQHYLVRLTEPVEIVLP